MLPIYVGKGTIKNRRAERHWRFGTDNALFSRVLAKIRAAGLNPIIEIVAQFDDEAAAFALESALIAKFGRRDRGAGPLVNMTDGGEGNANPSVEKRKRLAAAASAFHKGRPKSPEHRARIGAAQAGRKQDPEATAKSRAANLGRKATPAARANQSAARRGKPKSKEWSNKARAWLHNPEVDARRRAGVRSPQARAKIAAASRAMWARRALAKQESRNV